MLSFEDRYRRASMEAEAVIKELHACANDFGMKFETIDSDMCVRFDSVRRFPISWELLGDAAAMGAYCRRKITEIRAQQIKEALLWLAAPLNIIASVCHTEASP